jgi:hypothetical protein
VWIALCVVFFSISRLQGSLLQKRLFGNIWCLLYCSSNFGILPLLRII